jgi:hypothetical protein
MNRYPTFRGSCGTLIATFLALEALTTEQAVGLTDTRSGAVFSCDYNGWADVPEEEREGIDVFENAPVPPRAAVTMAITLVQSILAPRALTHRKAA